jgi:hypothetical protein
MRSNDIHIAIEYRPLQKVETGLKMDGIVPPHLDQAHADQLSNAVGA